MKNFSKIAAFFLLLSLAFQAKSQYMYMHNSMDRAAILNFLMYQKAKSEGENLRKWWKGEETVGIAICGPLTYSARSRYDSIPNVGQQSFDTTLSLKAKPLIGFHVNGNSNHLIARLGMSSILSVSIGEQIDFMRWTYDAYDEDTKTTSPQTIFSWKVGVPVTIDYKYGCDVDFNPDLKQCFAIGAGAMPWGALTLVNGGSSNARASVAPYIYASFGMYVWGCWKIRLSYQPGNFYLFKNETSGSGGVVSTFNLKGANIFGIGISHMSYSRDWRNGHGTRGSDGHRHGGGSTRMF